MAEDLTQKQLEALDDLTATLVMGWKTDNVAGTYWVKESQAVTSKELWRPTSDLNQAWRCLAVFRHTHHINLQTFPDTWETSFAKMIRKEDGSYLGHEPWVNDEGVTASIAIVKSCLRAKGHKV